MPLYASLNTEEGYSIYQSMQCKGKKRCTPHIYVLYGEYSVRRQPASIEVWRFLSGKQVAEKLGDFPRGVVGCALPHASEGSLTTAGTQNWPSQIYMQSVLPIQCISWLLAAFVKYQSRLLLGLCFHVLTLWQCSTYVVEGPKHIYLTFLIYLEAKNPHWLFVCSSFPS